MRAVARADLMQTESAVVAAVRHSIGEGECTLLLKDRAVVTSSPDLLEPYDLVRFDGTRARFESKGGRGIYSRRISAILKKIFSSPAQIKTDPRCEDAVKSMQKRIKEASTICARTYLSGAPISVRFHADGDGAAAAIAFYRMFNHISETGAAPHRQVSWHPIRENFYGVQQFETDVMLFNNYSSVEKPLVIGVDFGTAEESAPQFGGAGKFETVWIDHHPVPGNLAVPSNYINPMEHHGSSSISAGLVTSLVASLVGTNSSDLAEASLISDMSIYANRADLRALKVAEVLDYLTVRGSDHLRRPKGMESVLTDQNTLDSLYTEVHQMVENSLAAGLKIATRYTCPNMATVMVVNFAKIKRMGMDYPLPGRYASRLQHMLEQSSPRMITIVYYRSFISIRVGREISGKVDIARIISKMGAETNGSVKGGGHMEAASIDAGDFGMDNTLELLLHSMGAKAAN